MNRLDSDLLDQLAEFMLAPEGYPERLHRLKFPVATGGTLDCQYQRALRDRPVAGCAGADGLDRGDRDPL